MNRGFGLAVIALAVAPLAACGGSSTPSSLAGGGSTPTTSTGTQGNTSTQTAPKYAHEICTSLTGALAKVKSDTTAYEAQVQQDETKGVAKIKTDTVGYFSKVVTEFGVMRDGIANAGVPPISDGAAVRAELLKSFDQLLAVAKGAETDVKGLSTSDPQTFATKLEADGQKLGTAGTTIGKALENSHVSDSQLDSAFNGDPACKSLGATG